MDPSSTKAHESWLPRRASSIPKTEKPNAPCPSAHSSEPVRMRLSGTNNGLSPRR